MKFRIVSTLFSATLLLQLTVFNPVIGSNVKVNSDQQCSGSSCCHRVNVTLSNVKSYLHSNYSFQQTVKCFNVTLSNVKSYLHSIYGDYVELSITLLPKDNAIPDNFFVHNTTIFKHISIKCSSTQDKVQIHKDAFSKLIFSTKLENGVDVFKSSSKLLESFSINSCDLSLLGTWEFILYEPLDNLKKITLNHCIGFNEDKSKDLKALKGRILDFDGKFSPCDYEFPSTVICSNVSMLNVSHFFAKNSAMINSYNIKTLSLILPPFESNVPADLLDINNTNIKYININCQKNETITISPTAFGINEIKSSKKENPQFTLKYCDTSQLTWEFNQEVPERQCVKIYDIDEKIELICFSINVTSKTVAKSFLDIIEKLTINLAQDNNNITTIIPDNFMDTSIIDVKHIVLRYDDIITADAKMNLKIFPEAFGTNPNKTKKESDIDTKKITIENWDLSDLELEFIDNIPELEEVHLDNCSNTEEIIDKVKYLKNQNISVYIDENLITTSL